MKTYSSPYRVILHIPCLVAIASKHSNLIAPYYGCFYILNYNVISQSQGSSILYFIFHLNMRQISYLVQMLFSPLGTFMLTILTSYFSDALCKVSGARHSVYIFNRDWKLVSISVIPVTVCVY